MDSALRDAGMQVFTHLKELFATIEDVIDRVERGAVRHPQEGGHDECLLRLLPALEDVDDRHQAVGAGLQQRDCDLMLDAVCLDALDTDQLSVGDAPGIYGAKKCVAMRLIVCQVQRLFLAGR